MDINDQQGGNIIIIKNSRIYIITFGRSSKLKLYRSVFCSYFLYRPVFIITVPLFIITVISESLRGGNSCDLSFFSIIISMLNDPGRFGHNSRYINGRMHACIHIRARYYTNSVNYSRFAIYRF